jgi:hypothetical protein
MKAVLEQAMTEARKKDRPRIVAAAWRQFDCAGAGAQSRPCVAVNCENLAPQLRHAGAGAFAIKKEGFMGESRQYRDTREAPLDDTYRDPPPVSFTAVGRLLHQ